MNMPKIWRDEKKGLWRCDVQVDKVRHFLKSKDRATVVKDLGEILAGKNAPASSGDSFRLVALEFLKHKEAVASAGGYRYYEHHVLKKGGMIGHFEGRVYADIKLADYQRYIDNRLTTPSRRHKPKEGEPPRMLSMQTVEHERAILVQIALFAVERDLVPKATITARTLTRLKVPEAQPRMLSDAELSAVLRVCEEVSYTYKVNDQVLTVGGAAFRGLLELALRTGLRLSELERMTWDWVDIDTKTLIVGGKGSKSKKLGAIPLSARVIEILEQLPNKRGKIVLENWGPILEGESAARIYAQLRKVARRAGIPRFGLHAFRHAFGLNTLRATRSLYVTQKFLRHKDPRQTERYARLVPDELRAEIDAVDGRLNDITKVASLAAARTKKGKKAAR